MGAVIGTSSILRPFLLLAVSFGLTGAALGAFTAYGLKKQFNVEYLAVFQTGVRYQLVHALALFGVALFATRLDDRLVSVADGLFTLGILLFSGNLYLLTLSGIGKFGIVTPFGDVFFLAGWLCLGLAVWCLGNA